MLFLGCNVKKHNLRYFHFDYEVEIESTDGKKLELWIPVPQTNEVQTISQLSFQIILYIQVNYNQWQNYKKKEVFL